jgi:hypothetical protein
MVNEIKCGRCENGTSYWDEDGKTVQDTCYHCGGTGMISEEESEHDQDSAVADTLASALVNWKFSQAEDADGDNGYDFGLIAAENMMTVSEYKKGMEYDTAAQFASEMEALSPALKRALRLALAPKPEKVAPVAVNTLMNVDGGVGFGTPVTVFRGDEALLDALEAAGDCDIPF